MNIYPAFIEWLTPFTCRMGGVSATGCAETQAQQKPTSKITGTTLWSVASTTHKETSMPSNVTEEMITEASEIAALLMQKAGVAYNSYGSARDTAGRHIHAEASATILAAMIVAAGNPTNG